MVYTALLRGVNVGGKNKIRMEDLKRAFGFAGVFRAETYIQSGNVIFESCEAEETLRKKLEILLQEKFGFPVPVILRTALELEELILACPFSEEEVAAAEEASGEGESLYVVFLDRPAPREALDRLKTYESGDDHFKTRGRELVLLLRHSIRNSRLANRIGTLGETVTIRSWKTVQKLCFLAEARKTTPVER